MPGFKNLKLELETVSSALETGQDITSSGKRQLHSTVPSTIPLQKRQTRKHTSSWTVKHTCARKAAGLKGVEAAPSLLTLDAASLGWGEGRCGCSEARPAAGRGCRAQVGAPVSQSGGAEAEHVGRGEWSCKCEHTRGLCTHAATSMRGSGW